MHMADPTMAKYTRTFEDSRTFEYYHDTRKKVIHWSAAQMHGTAPPNLDIIGLARFSPDHQNSVPYLNSCFTL
jgi:hypothetical protein